MTEPNSIDIARAAIKMALSENRSEEKTLKTHFNRQQIRTVAVDYGGEYIASLKRVVERAIVAAKREKVIKATHLEEGAVAGATREALAQIMNKAMGLNIGGKIGIARKGEHISICVFFGVGLLHLNEVAVGLAHRAIPNSEENEQG
ncbi:MAG: HutP family protein [bacterium]|jgi:hypothetical protein